MMLKLRIVVFKSHLFIAKNFFPNLWNAQTAFIIRPGFTIQLQNTGIDKNLFKSGSIEWALTAAFQRHPPVRAAQAAD